MTWEKSNWSKDDTEVKVESNKELLGQKDRKIDESSDPLSELEEWERSNTSPSTLEHG